jgi:hypothetical protein
MLHRMLSFLWFVPVAILSHPVLLALDVRHLYAKKELSQRISGFTGLGKARYSIIMILKTIFKINFTSEPIFLRGVVF